ncbi:response regulator [Granulicella cerasi]|uniref:Response regulator n=1 Tax=Granulicella cerasi TaxID=741063 RepID=A0ABW1Z909_9BACT|nr:response regulator [Granulicella cerasi]
MSEQNLVDAAQMVFADDFSGNFDSAGDNDFEPQTDGDGQAAPGQGQSKSSRRRRRKRKSKVGTEGSPANAGGESASGEGETSAPQTIVMEGESLALAAGAEGATQQQPRQQQQRRQQNGGQQQGGQQNGQQGQGEGKRWKKKFRDRERRTRTDNPGNEFRSADSNNNGGGGQRQRSGGRPDNFGNLAGGFKGRQQKQGGKERGFVGPMDHSYRAASSEFGGGPPSTINLNGQGGRRQGGRHHGDSQPIDHNMPRAIPIPENAQTHIYFFIEELFFNAKIQETAKKQGVKIAFLKNDKESIDLLTSGSDENKPALIVFDLNNANAKPLTTIPKLKAKLKRSVSIIGFLSHLQGELKAKAMEAGCDVVMPRAAFSQNLPNLLRRYGAEEEDEINYNY